LPSEHTVQTVVGADIFADISILNFPSCSVDEIRSHHVFEHFNRSVALALLCKWHQWLKIGGTLIVETPDFEASINSLVSSRYNYHQKQVIIRHIFGSHENYWAIHCDGGTKKSFTIF